MLSLYDTWAGLFIYKDPRMPKMISTVTFSKTVANQFEGFLTEEPMILPEVFNEICKVSDRNLLTPWGYVSGKIIEGELHDQELRDYGRAITFVRLPDQLTNYPMICKGGFKEAANRIIGAWGLLEGDTPFPLPVEMKCGFFLLEKMKKDPDPTVDIVPPKVVLEIA